MSKSRKNQFTQAAYPSEAEVSERAKDFKDFRDHKEDEAAVEADMPRHVPTNGVPDAEEADMPRHVPTEEEVAVSAAAGDCVSREEMARAVAEAEQRGYMRGRNEAMSQPMCRNGIWEQPHRQEEMMPASEGVDDADDDLVLLRRIRPSIWD